MGYASALLAKDVSAEQEKLERESKRKGLFGSIGRTLGGLAATIATGGAAAPWAVGLASGAGSLAGGALGSAAAGGISGGKFFQSSRDRLRGELNPFGAENITGALTSGMTAGLGQKAKIAAGVSRAESTAALVKGATAKSITAAGEKAGLTRGFDFAGSGLGKFGKAHPGIGQTFGKIGQTLMPGGESGYLPDRVFDFSSISSPYRR